MLNNNAENLNSEKPDANSGSKRQKHNLEDDSTQSKRQKVLGSDLKVQFLPISSTTLIGTEQSNPPQTFSEFILNLRGYAKGKPTDFLTRHICEEDLMTIFDYFYKNTKKNKTAIAFGQKIKVLLPNQTLTLDKNDTHLPRTLKVTRKDGVFELFIEGMMPPKTLKELICNIYVSQFRTPSNELLALISLNDLLKIFDYFTDNNEKNLTFKEVSLKIKNLGVNESLRLDKHKTQLPRTLNIIRKEGECIFLLETKSKLADGTKRILPTAKGAFKKGKPCYRIDFCEIEYFNLVTHLKDAKDLEARKNEVNISQKFSCQYIDSKILGEQFERNGQSKISIYSEKANCGSLKTFFKNNEYKHLTLAQKYALLLDICMGIKVFHDQNHVHQDIKPDNILIKGNPQIGYHAMLTDFGLVVDIQKNKAWAKGTLWYQSPEISKVFEKPKPNDAIYMYHYNYWNNPNVIPTLAHQLMPQTEKHITPHKANDMWALGIVAYQMLFNRLPLLPGAKANIEANPLLKGLLEPNRNNRFTIEQTIANLEELLKPKLILAPG